MKRAIVILIIFILKWHASTAQISWPDYSESYPDGDHIDTSVMVMTAINSQNNSFWVGLPSDSDIKKLEIIPGFFRVRPRYSSALSAYDTLKAQFFVHGISKLNANKYEFRVVDNKSSIIVPWTNISKFTAAKFDVGSETKQIAYLGGYKAPIGSILVVDVREKRDDSIVSYSVVFWKAVKPVLLDIYTSNELNEFLNRIKEPDPYVLSEKEIAKWNNTYPIDQIDLNTNLPKKLTLAPSENNIIFYLKAEIYKREQVEYELIKDEKIFIPWKINDFDNSFIWLKGLLPGDYRLIIRYAVQRDNETSYPFEIKPAWIETTSFKFIEAGLLSAFLGFVILSVRFIQQRRQILLDSEKKEKLQLELRNIYTQLNPHFIFNCLNSIQGLINSQKIASANIYLSIFGKLMRESLENSKKDFISLKEEVEALETYLKLEQLRFDFKYDFIVDNKIDTNSVNFPALLLQPLVENSVKHGVSALGQSGLITIKIEKANRELKIQIKDNGNGFPINLIHKGYGIRLTKDRISFLNEVLTNQSISLKLDRNREGGIMAEFILNNWLNEVEMFDNR